jgi:hypothetical protein
LLLPDELPKGGGAAVVLRGSPSWFAAVVLRGNLAAWQSPMQPQISTADNSHSVFDRMLGRLKLGSSHWKGCVATAAAGFASTWH